jgi:hypothetical protein
MSDNFLALSVEAILALSVEAIVVERMCCVTKCSLNNSNMILSLRYL